MKLRLNLKPGQKGTKRLVEQFGKALLELEGRIKAEFVTAGKGKHPL
ncbi:MAG TPA: hypothetical protein VF795_05970 [Desulfuromonadaceae bacterium]